MLHLRATHLPGDFDACWRFHAQQDQQRLHPEAHEPSPENDHTGMIYSGRHGGFLHRDSSDDPGAGRRQGDSSGMSGDHSSGDWLDYFDDLGQQGPLYRAQSAIFVHSLAAEIGLRQEDRVLDFGCGFGFVAAALAPLVGEVWVWDPAPNMRAATARNTAGLGNVHWCVLAGEHRLQAHDSGSDLESLDLVLVNSVAQYMPPHDLWAWLASWRPMLASDGRVVMSDLISSVHGGWRDMADLVRLGARHGSPLRAVRDALGGLNRYRRTSRAAPLVRVDEAELRRRATKADLEVTVLGRNLTHFSRRWTAVLRPPPSRSP